MRNNATRCETLIQPHFNRKFIPSSRKENTAFQSAAVLCWLKSGNTMDDKELCDGPRSYHFFLFSAFMPLSEKL